MIGQAHVTEPLMTALRTSRIGHAYLFSGPRGCGKTTSARILARCLNCAEGPTDHPCGVCPSCIELSRDGGGSLDVVEIDAASHGGVDDARDLRERAVFAPARDRFKIFIIDEAHMVTAGGFNALLKIVEEPPPHVKFIFATTEPEKVIGTIRSRTHHYPFRLIAPGALIDYVQQLCDSEGVQVEPGVLALVVRSGGGSVRDTLSILDQLIAGSESTQVTLERATGLLGFTSTELIDEVVNALGAGDSAAAFRATDRVVQTGQDPRRFVEDLLERLRDLIVISATSVQGASAVFRGVPEDQLDSMFAQSQIFGHGQLSRIADTVNATLNTMVGATAPRLHLELMVARALLNAGAGVPAAGAAGALLGGGASSRQAPGQNAGAGAGAGAGVPVTNPAGGQHTASNSAQVAQASAMQATAPSPVSVSVSVSAPAAVAEAASATSSTPVVPSGAAVDVIAAMRSARDFLKSDDSGSPRPPMVPLGGHRAPDSDPAAVSVPATAEVPAEVPAVAGEANDAPVTVEPGLDDLLEVWPDLLDELLESDREAWNAVRQVQPLALDGDVLTIGLATKSDLDAFKTSGAGPLREAISGAIGMNIKYVPKPLPEGVRPAFAGREGDDSPAEEPSLTAEPTQSNEATQPAKFAAVSSPTVATPDDYPEPPEALESEPGYEPEPGYGPAAEYEPDPEPEPEAKRGHSTDPASYPNTAVSPTPATTVSPVPEAASATNPATPPVAETASVSLDAPAQSTPKPKRNDSPGFTRYGESVVREVLGARFVEERPLPEGFER